MFNMYRSALATCMRKEDFRHGTHAREEDTKLRRAIGGEGGFFLSLCDNDRIHSGRK